MYILGISAYYHDSAAALLYNGKVIAAAQEERFTRIKHDQSFPCNAIRYVIEQANIDQGQIQSVVFYEKPFLKFERLLVTHHDFVPHGLISFAVSIPIWVKEKLFLKSNLKSELHKIGLQAYELYFSEHHVSHAASAFFPSPYKEAAVLIIDGVGEWSTVTIGQISYDEFKILKEIHFPHSIGLLYSSFTAFLGFKVNNGEYKVMGLAPYGNLESPQTKEFIKQIKAHLIDIRSDGSFVLNMKYFSYATKKHMIPYKLWEKLFGIKTRKQDTALTQDHANLALAIQNVLEDCIFKLVRTARKIIDCDNLVMAGGVALNSVANGRLLYQDIFKNIWVQPASSDAGGALGAAYTKWFFDNKRYDSGSDLETENDSMNGCYLGPEYSTKEIKRVLDRKKRHFQEFKNFESLSKYIAQKISDGNIVGWFQGRMEFGPRALGNRSILADPRSPEMQRELNLSIKFREGFRPFAPSVLEEDCKEYFDLDQDSPYMLLVRPIKKSRRIDFPENFNNLSIAQKMVYKKSDIPAVTHVDYSARIQTVSQKTNPKFWSLINDFKKITGYGLLVNTSFNVRGEPIVCSPTDALNCFEQTNMDILVLENCVLEK